MFHVFTKYSVRENVSMLVHEIENGYVDMVVSTTQRLLIENTIESST